MRTAAAKGFHLSLQQARLWAMPGDKQVYRCQCKVLLEGSLDSGRFQRACEHLVERHAILRSVFYQVPGMDMPMQVILNDGKCTYVESNLADLDAQGQDIQAERLVQRLRDEPIDLANGPLSCFFLLHLSAERHLLLLRLPALCADAATLQLLIKELSQIYAAHLRGEELVETPLQYIDVSAWQNELLREEDIEQHKTLWRSINLSQLASQRLPFEQSKELESLEQETRQYTSFVPAHQEMVVEKIVSDQLRALARHNQVSQEALLLACWQILLWRLTGEENSVIAIACEGRTYEELTDCPGLYTRFVPLSNSFGEDRPFIQVVNEVSKALQEILEEQYFFVWEQAPSSSDASAHAGRLAFPVSFTYESWPEQIIAGGISYKLKQTYSYQEWVGLGLRAVHVGERLHLSLQYDTARLHEAEVQRIFALFGTLLHNAVQQPQELAGRLPLLTEREHQKLLETFAPPPLPYSQQPWHRLVEAQAARTPTQVAVVCGKQHLSYQELNKQANRLAWQLRGLGVGPNKVVGLCMERSVDLLVGLLAVFKAGGVYLPLDAGWPRERLLYALQETQALVLLTHSQLRERLAIYTGTVLYLDKPEIVRDDGAEGVSNLPEQAGLEDLAYVIYTSGSTGTPKGIAIRQSSLLNYIHAISRRLAVRSGLQWACVSTIAADLGHTVLFPALMSGGSLHLVPYEILTSGEDLARYSREQGIDVLKIVPTHLSALLASCPVALRHDLLPREALLLGGEALRWRLIDQLRSLQSTCRVFNHYGPTETTVGVLIYELGVLSSQQKSAQIHNSATVPIGRPLANAEVYIVDRYGQLVPAGVTGELMIAGAGLAAGYLRQPEQTSRFFIAHPLRGEGARAYRTGDWARSTVDEQIEYVGRADSQVKVRGYRIELEEIEAMLHQHQGVEESVVLAREDIPDEMQLVAYVVVKQEMTGATDELRAYLQTRLPDHMVPSHFICLKALPITPNGKIDRRGLPAPDSVETKTDQALVAPRSPIEELVANCWKEVLRIKEVGVHDNFFEKGGHSLLATQLISRVRASIQAEVSLAAFFDDPTVAGLAEQARQALPGEHALVPPLVPVARNIPLPLSFAQQRLWFLYQLNPGSSAYNIPIAIRLTGMLDVNVLERSLGEIVGRHEILRTAFKELDGCPTQIINPPESFHLQQQDLGELDLEQREAEARRLAHQEAACPFDLEQGPLLRASLLRLGEREHILLLTMHHIVTDGWSSSVFIRELSALYAAFLEGKPSPLPMLPIQYADFAVWQRQWLRDEVLERQIRYWRKRLGGAAALQLPTDRSRPAMPSYRGSSQAFRLPAQLSQELVRLSRQEGVTLFMTLLAAFQTLFYRYTGQDDIVIGTDIANRTQIEIEPLIGFFINLLILRTDLSEKPGFQQVLKQVRKTVLEAYAHQDAPFEKLVEMLQPQLPTDRMPLVQVLFVLQNVPMPQEELPGLTVSPFSNEVTSSKFDLALFMQEGTEALRGTFVYNTDLFDLSTIENMAQHFEILLHDIIARPDASVDMLEIYSNAEKEQQRAKRKARQTSNRQSLKLAKEEKIGLTEVMAHKTKKE